jgi:hypothetical protein
MSTRLVNVRLDEEHMKKVRRLRANGVILSELVRETIDQRYDQLVRSPRRRDAEAIMNGIYREYPDPPDLPHRNHDVHRSGEAREAVRRKLHDKRP